MLTVAPNNRTEGVARIGCDCGTNRDPELFESDRRAHWAALTKGSKPEHMEPAPSQRGSKDWLPRPWADTNLYYMCGRT
jgi:hypothetical protein